MGKLDQFGKALFTQETPNVTQGILSFEVPPETPMSQVEADGLLHLKKSRRLQTLPHPWRLFSQDEVVLELKMQGDHIDKKALKRALLQRQAREFWRYEHEGFLGDTPLWLVAAHLPQWLKNYCTVLAVAGGCYRLSPALFDWYWIASNELPLAEELIPFLVTRTGKALEDFTRWVLGRRTPSWIVSLLAVVPMRDEFVNEILSYLPDTQDKEELRRRRFVAKAIAEKTPGVKEEFLQEGEELALRHILARRLGHELRDEEKAALSQKLAELGHEKVSDLLLEKTKDEVAAWLLGPKKAAKKAPATTPKKGTQGKGKK